MHSFRFLDILAILVYFGGITGAGIYFSRRNKDTEDYFLGGRKFKGWVIGLSMVGTSISSMTFMAFPGDGYRTAWLRLLPSFTLPIGIYIASRWFLPFYRRTKTTSAYEYLERRYGPGTRFYVAIISAIGLVMRLGAVLFLLSLLLNQIMGFNLVACIFVAGIFVSFYTIAGGIEAVIWTDVAQTLVLIFGGLVCLAVIAWQLPGGLGQIISESFADGKFNFAEATVNNKVTFQGVDTDWGSILSFKESSWDLTLYRKTILMMLIMGIQGWLFEYSSSQMVVQRFCASESPREARKAMWICCFTSIPIWVYFMFLGSAIYVFFKHFPDEFAFNILVGNEDRKAEEILPFFVLNYLPAGLGGLVVAAVMAAAMSSLDSAINAFATIGIVDVYKRHIVKNSDEKHYLRVARWLSVAASVLMILIAWWYTTIDMKTFSDTGIVIGGVCTGGVLGIYMLGFLVPLGDGRAMFWGIMAATVFSVWRAGILVEWWGSPGQVWYFTDNYYTGMLGHAAAFVVGFLAAGIIQILKREKRDWTNLTVWTQDGQPLQ